MDGTNQKCKSRKRSDRTETTRTRVGGVLSVSYHSQGPAAQPPESLLYSMDSAYPLSINKIGNGGERKEREKEVFIEEALHRTNEDPEEWVWAFEKMKMQRVKKKSFMNNRPLRADGDSRTGKRGTRHLLNNTKNKAIPCPREKQEAWHEIRGGKNSDSELRMEGRTK